MNQKPAGFFAAPCMITSIILVLVAFQADTHAGTRHKGMLDKLPVLESKKNVTDKSTHKTAAGETAPKDRTGAGAATTTAALYTQPKSGQCQFTTASGFDAWKILQILPAQAGKILLLAKSEKVRIGGTLLELDTSTHAISLPLGDQPWITQLYTHPSSGAVVALTQNDGIFAYSALKNNWQHFFPKETFQGFAWTAGSLGLSIRKKGNDYILTRIETAQGTQLDENFKSYSPLTVLDASHDAKKLLILKQTSSTTSELILWSNKTTHSLSTGSRTIAAHFSANFRNVISVEDIDGKKPAAWIRPLTHPERARPLSAEKNPVWQLALSPDRSTLVLGTQEWGLKHSKLMRIDPNGTPQTEWDQLSLPHESLTLFPLSQKGNQPMALAISSNPEAQDTVQSVTGTLRVNLWSQKEFQCLAYWWRLPITASDKVEYLVDIYEPHAPTSERKIVYFISQEATPHTPDYSAVRLYWLQNGWTVLEPHLRGSTEQGTQFLQLTRSWANDILEMKNLIGKKFLSPPKIQTVITESSPKYLNSNQLNPKPLNPHQLNTDAKQHFSLQTSCRSNQTEGTECLSQDLARLLLTSEFSH